MLTETIALFITAIGVVWGVVTYHLDRRRNRQIATLEAYKVLQKEVFSELNKWTPKEVQEASEDNRSDGYKKLGELLAEIERFYIGVNTRVYDFNIFYMQAHGFFDSEWGLKSKLAPLLEAKHKRAHEDYYSNIHKVWIRMDKRSRKRSWKNT